MWTQEDIRVASVLEAGLGQVRVVEVIEHEENSVTDTVETNAPEDMDWSEAEGPLAYPEVPANPHNHTYTWSPKLPDGSMLVIRSSTAQGLVEATEAMAPHAARLKAAWAGVLGQPQAPAQQASPFGQPTPPPFGPNVSVPGAPGYQGPPQAQAAPQWGAPQAPQGGFGGGAQQANGRQGPKPRPDWPMVYAIDVPFAAKDAFKAFREQNKDALRGKVAWAGGGKYWVHGDVAQGFAQYNPLAA